MLKPLLIDSDVSWVDKRPFSFGYLNYIEFLACMVDHRQINVESSLASVVILRVL